MSEFDELLDRFRAQGTVDSEGDFTWDYQRALELLPQFQFSSDDSFWLRLFASAIASRARNFGIASTNSGYSISWDGREYSYRELEVLFPSILSHDVALSEMAIAVGLAARSYSDIELRSGQGTLSIKGGVMNLQRTAQIDRKVTLALGKPKNPGIYGQIRILRTLKHRNELSSLTDRCKFAFVAWSLPSGVSIARPPIKAPVIRFGSMLETVGETLLYRHMDNTFGHGILILNGKKTNPILVHLGIQHDLEQDAFDVPGQVVWWYDGLPMSLGREVIRGAEYSAWKHWLNQELRSALKETIKAAANTPSAELIQEWLIQRAGSDEARADSPITKANILKEGCEAFIRAQRYREALNCAEQATRQNSSYLPWVALCLGLMGEFETAIDAYERAVEREPNSAWILGNFAEDLWLAGHDTRALENLEKAILLDKGVSGHPIALKAKIIAKERPDEALELLKKALSINNCPVSAHETKALILRDKSDYRGAWTCLKEFVRRADPATLWENNLDERVRNAQKLITEFEETEQ